MKYKTGDKVRVKGIMWYNANKDEDGNVGSFVSSMADWCEEQMTIKRSGKYEFTVKENDWIWNNNMIECMVSK